MEIQDVINRVELYGFESAVRGSTQWLLICHK